MYIESVSTNVTLPTTNVFGAVKVSICGFSGKPVVTAMCGKSAEGARWVITEIEPCDKEVVSEVSYKLRNLSLVIYFCPENKYISRASACVYALIVKFLYSILVLITSQTAGMLLHKSGYSKVHKHSL